jgi:hypothetical protein
MLYFEKPESGQKYFNVLEAVYNPIESVSNNIYVYTDSSTNNKTTCTYANTKILEQSTTNHTLYNLTFSLKKYTPLHL